MKSNLSATARRPPNWPALTVVAALNGIEPGLKDMCRLYGMFANEPTKVECSLVKAQNALMAQSRGDREGMTHGHGWGIAELPNGWPIVEKQAWAAYHGEHFQKSAARAYSRVVIAHVRRATGGSPSLENTHPFVHGHWLFAHNGTVPNFDAVRERLVDAMNPLQRSEIRGTTDSEHVFRYLLTLWQHNPQTPLAQTLCLGLKQVVTWCRAVDPAAPIALNVLWTDGDRFVGSRLGRSLWYLERDGVVLCEICGQSHVHHDHRRHYRAVEIASEPITDEEWMQVPDACVFDIMPNITARFTPLRIGEAASE